MRRSYWLRFLDSVNGFRNAWQEEANFRLECFAAVTTLSIGYAVGLTGTEWLFLFLAIILVMLAELLNTAVERVVDFAAAGRRHPLAGQAKDVAAAAVFLSVVHALVIAAYLFAVARPFSATLGALAGFFRDQTLVAAVLTALAAAVGAAGLAASRRR